MIRAVTFDVGETLVDETREYGTWADWLGVPRHTFASVFGSVIESGKDYRETFQVFRPGFDLTMEREARTAAGQPEWFGEDDLYPDVRSTLSDLRAAGVWVGIAGNQTARAGDLLRALDLPADSIATSDDWGVEKPNPLFFEKVVQVSPIDEPSEVVYVGDRIDNDLRPAKMVGLKTVFIQRGPWGWISRNSPELDQVADWRVTSLREILGLLPVS
jgi:HAD superfamily hydrolase (TIGR01549 family)